MSDDFWEAARYADGSFALNSLYRSEFSQAPSSKACELANNIAIIRPIKSRQVAAVVLALMWERRDD